MLILYESFKKFLVVYAQGRIKVYQHLTYNFPYKRIIIITFLQPVNANMQNTTD